MQLSTPLWVGGACLSLLAGSSAWAAPVILPPSSKWVLDYADEKCRLGRIFGNEEDRAVLYFEQGAPGDDLGLTAAGPQLRRFQTSRATLLRFSEVGEARRTTPFSGEVKTIGPSLIFTSMNFSEEDDDALADDQPDQPGLPAIDLTEAARANFVEFGRAGSTVRFETGNLKEPMAALNQCSADLVRSWGLDLDRHRTATRRPAWSNRDAIVRKIVGQYPSAALRQGEQGIVRLRVMVDEAGAVTACTVEKATTTETLESPACKAMQDARFEPALDAEGKAMPSYYAMRIVYRVED